MKILFIGCVLTSQAFLQRLIDIEAEIVGVITKSESKFNSDFVDLGVLCQKYKIDYKYTQNINDEECLQYALEKNPDVIFCFGWSQLIKKELLDIPPFGAIGFHPAELPYNKGRHPLIWAMVLGLDKTASTFFYMNESPDSGNIVSQESIIIEYEDTANDLYNRVLEAAEKQVVSIVRTLENKLVPEQLTSANGNTWRKRGKEDGKIDWRMSSRAIYNLIRALSKPYVGAHFEYQGQEYKVWSAKEVITDQYKNIEPGKVIKVFSEKQFLVKAYDNLIMITDCDFIKLKNGEYL